MTSKKTRYLLDTHALIWALSNQTQLPKAVLAILLNTDNDVSFCQISLVEIAIKRSIDKLPGFDVSTEEIIERAETNELRLLSLQADHIEYLANTPVRAKHRDPMDRLILATAAAENMVLLTADEKFNLYTDLIKIIWE